ncbi:hypothetical protein ABZV14_00405 [Streptosporangium canum]|uniref:hypothetical protein n=1 Tax=Streptosporangium canum TaxID=324952 RepID=UPI0033BA2C1A
MHVVSRAEGVRLTLADGREPVHVAAVQDVVMRHGVWLRPFGRLIYTMPPYSVGDDLERVTTAMTAAARALGPG